MEYVHHSDHWLTSCDFSQVWKYSFTLHPAPKFRSCHKAIMVIMARAHCLIYFAHCPCSLSTLLDWVDSLLVRRSLCAQQCSAHCSQFEHYGDSTMQSFPAIWNRTFCVQVQELSIKPLWGYPLGHIVLYSFTKHNVHMLMVCDLLTWVVKCICVILVHEESMI